MHSQAAPEMCTKLRENCGDCRDAAKVQEPASWLQLVRSRQLPEGAHMHNEHSFAAMEGPATQVGANQGTVMRHAAASPH